MLSISEGVAPGYYLVVPSRHRSACGVQSVVGYHPEDRGLSLFIALRWMQRPERVMVWLTEKYPSLLERFSDGHSIYGSQETSCIHRKGFLWFLSYDTDRGSRGSRGSKGSKGSNPSYPSDPFQSVLKKNNQSCGHQCHKTKTK